MFWLRNKKIIVNYALLSGGIYKKIVLSDVFSAVMSHALKSHGLHMKRYLLSIKLDWLQSLKQFFINVSSSYTCSQSNSDGSVLKQSHQS